MLNLRIVARALSGLILLEAVLMGLCYALSFYSNWCLPRGESCAQPFEPEGQS